MDFGADFKNLIKEKELTIKRRTASGINENFHFKRVQAMLGSYLDARPSVGNSFYAVIIENSDILNLNKEVKDNLFDAIDNCIREAHNHLILDKDLRKVHSEKKSFESSGIARQTYTEISKGNSVFLLSSQGAGIHVFAEGLDKGDFVFFTTTELVQYKELKDITQIKKLFEEYRKRLNQRDTYSKFFAPNSLKRALYSKKSEQQKEKIQEDVFLDKYKHLLNNSPEDRFREDLRVFLDERMKHNVFISKEHILENFERIDIFINDDYGDLYLIEVKWVGVSIHASGTKVGTPMRPSQINPSAIIQTLNYLIELEETGRNIKLGYLVVFDARKKDSNDTVSTFDTTDFSERQKIFLNRYEKIKDFRVINHHPN